MTVAPPPGPLSRRKRFLISFRKDFLFWICLLLMLGIVFFVPQVGEVIFQTAQKASSPQSVPRTRVAAWIPPLYLLYLALLLTGVAASVLFVVPPPSFGSTEPGRARPTPRRRAARAGAMRGLGVLSVVAIGGFLDGPMWLGPAHPWLSLLLLGLLLFPWVRGVAVRGSSWPVSAAKRWPALCRGWFGLALVLGGLFTWGLVSWLGVKGWRQPGCPLGLVALNGLGLVLFLTGLWFSLVAWWGAEKLSANRGLTASGRLVGWMACGWLGGEMIWLFASSGLGLGEGLAYRLYTIWTSLEMLVLVVFVGSLLDTWQAESHAPVRLGGILAIAVLALVLRWPGHETLESPAAVEARAVPSEWPQHLLNRIKQVPPGEPVVLLAASGGGSRAAIFAGLVLEGLAREPFPGAGNKNWGDHIVLISGVSGGGLGTARFVHGLGTADWQNRRRAPLRHSLGTDLAARMHSVADQMSRQLGSPKEEKRIKARYDGQIDVQFCDAFFADHKAALQHARETEPGTDRAWVMQSEIMDDLCMDFMAPALRGLRTPLLSRGESLRLFWRDQFRWDGSNDRGGHARPAGAGPFEWKDYPLVIFNAADVDRGSRLAIGFPPLPAGFRMTAGRPRLAFNDLRRYPPETLADLDPDRSIDLHQAVALSANFPFGFTALTIPRRNASDGAAATARVLDGGIVDNTGIDTLFVVLQSIKEGKEAKDAQCREVWAELENRRVLLVEIAAGKKPSATGPAAEWLWALGDPLASLRNARFANAALAKQYYLAALHDWFPDPELANLARQVAEVETELGPTARALGDNLSLTTSALQKCLQHLQAVRGTRFASIRLECDHFGEHGIQTAWSLGPEDKARLLVRFLIEMQLQRGELKQWARETTRQDAGELVQQQLKAFFCPLLGKALDRATADQARAEERLNEVERLAVRFQIALPPDVASELSELRKAIRAGPVSLATTVARLKAAWKRFEPNLLQQRQDAEARVTKLLPRVKPEMDWQMRLQLRALLSRELHDSTGAGR